MSNAIFNPPTPINEPILNYGKGSAERTALQAAIKEMKRNEVDVPLFIGGTEVRTGNIHDMRPPHELSHKLGVYHEGDASHVRMAIDAAMESKPDWENMSFENRAAIFLKAADLLATTYRMKINAATMLGQSKNAYQAEIDYCPECRGVWLDRGELDKIMERAGDHYAKRENYDNDYRKYHYGDSHKPQQGYPYKKKKSFFSDFFDFD